MTFYDLEHDLRAQLERFRQQQIARINHDVEAIWESVHARIDKAKQTQLGVPSKRRAWDSLTPKEKIEAVQDALVRCDGNKTRAAESLGIRKKALYTWLKRSDEPQKLRVVK